MNSSSPIKHILAQKPQQAIFSVEPDTTVFAAMTVMMEKGTGSVLVMQGGKLLGVVSERDCVRKVLLKDKTARQTTVKDIMSAPVFTVGPDETAEKCMNLMTEKRIRHLPMVEGERVIGVVSIGDIVKWLVSKQEETIQHLEKYITGSYPG